MSRIRVIRNRVLSRAAAALRERAGRNSVFIVVIVFLLVAGLGIGLGSHSSDVDESRSASPAETEHAVGLGDVSDRDAADADPVETRTAENRTGIRRDNELSDDVTADPLGAAGEKNGPSGPAGSEDELDAADDSFGFPDGAAEPPLIPSDAPEVGEPVALDPADPGPHPCDGVLASGAQLLVTPDPMVLEPGAMSSSLTIANCGDAAVDWTAQTVLWVAPAAGGGTIEPGSNVELGYQIDGSALAPGAFDFKIKVSEPGHNVYVDVHGFRPAVGTDFVPAGIGFTAGPGSGGCANQCITKAWLTPNATSADLSLEVTTNVPASTRVFVSQAASQLDGDGNPYFPGVTAIAATSMPMTVWNTPLAPLAPTTTYNIIVEATDGNDKTSYRVGQFTTITPVGGPGQLAFEGEEPGCSLQCITTALLTPTGVFSSVDLEVKTHTPAKVDVFMSETAPAAHGGVPAVGGAPVATTGGALVQEWQTSLSGLVGGTTYHVVVVATDANGNQAFQQGTFATGDEPQTDMLIQLHRVRVTYDGDQSPGNRGELSFGWAVNSDHVSGIGEQKLHGGDTVTFPDHKNKWAVLDVGEWLPAPRVAGFERDADGIVEFCAMGGAVPLSAGSSSDCDVTWNVATGGLHLTENIDAMPRCSEFGINDNWAGSACMELVSEPHGGDDYPHFTAVVGFHIP